jgi:hypothetical protein
MGSPRPRTGHNRDAWTHIEKETAPEGVELQNRQAGPGVLVLIARQPRSRSR